ncbi:MAG: type II toxin-antitoxin system RelE/ParE family toxin [Heliobacteriaceae bacterium]|jgi:proteic killer suppression protein|nr:type II toxin-antitoxin system RelE/ParE family toxin [Heliobacteriaceae bacterium]
MIKSFKHKGLEKFYTTGSLKGIQAIHANRLTELLMALNMTTEISDLNSPSYRLHPLKGDLKGLWSVTVQANWRLTFKFENNNVYILDYQDYH